MEKNKVNEDMFIEFEEGYREPDGFWLFEVVCEKDEKAKCDGVVEFNKCLIDDGHETGTSVFCPYLSPTFVADVKDSMEEETSH